MPVGLYVCGNNQKENEHFPFINNYLILYLLVSLTLKRKRKNQNHKLHISSQQRYKREVWTWSMAYKCYIPVLKPRR